MGARARLPRVVALVSGAALLAATASALAQSRAFFDDLLRKEMRFSTAEMRSLEAGSAVMKSIETPVRQELAHLGVVFVGAPAERFLGRFRDIERFESGPGILQIGRFDRVPNLNDLAALSLPAADIGSLAQCRPGHCDVKLSAAAIAAFRTQVNWSSPDATRQANDITRGMILDLVRAYQAEGNAALGRYDDGSEPLAVPAEFRAILAGREKRPVPVPELIAYLDTYPRGRPAGAEDFFYWALVDFGLRPTIRVNHVVIYPIADGPSGVTSVIAIKQLYASHYFHTTLELRFLVDAVQPAHGRGFYILSIIRSRNDGMTGFKGLLLRPIISRRSREGVRGYLEHVKRQVERSNAEDGGSK